ncbi:unnamed protein product [Paramecium sonneborni]|uniref:EF-hand domain-containing protein n=1 Tax=Paramecium sonneborni TaxID=65129 RepID=A0A8S1QMI5_9CILI|nr:unnamed protein product [Paramecium sonneborni]
MHSCFKGELRKQFKINLGKIEKSDPICFCSSFIQKQNQKPLCSKKKLLQISNCPQQLFKLLKIAITQHYSIIHEKMLSKNHIYKNRFNQYKLVFVQNNLNCKIRIFGKLPKYINQLLIQNLILFQLKFQNHHEIYEDFDTSKIIFENYIILGEFQIQKIMELVCQRNQQIIDIVNYLHQHKLNSFALNDQKDQKTIKLIDIKRIFIKAPLTIQNASYLALERFCEYDMKGKQRDIWFLIIQRKKCLKNIKRFKKGFFDMSSLQNDKFSYEAKEFLSNILQLQIKLLDNQIQKEIREQSQNRFVKYEKTKKKLSLLQYCVLQYMATQYFNTQSSNIIQAFNDIDTNKDGKITLYELMNAYQKFYENYKDTFSVQQEIISY